MSDGLVEQPVKGSLVDVLCHTAKYDFGVEEKGDVIVAGRVLEVVTREGESYCIVSPTDSEMRHIILDEPLSRIDLKRMVAPELAADSFSLPVYYNPETNVKARWERYATDFESRASAVEEGLWGLCAIAASITSEYGKQTMAEFAKLQKYSRSRIYQFAEVYRMCQEHKINPDPSLAFGYYQQAARTEKPSETLELAINNEWGVNDFKHAISTNTLHIPDQKELRKKAIEPNIDPIPEVRTALPAMNRLFRFFKEEIVDNGCMVCKSKVQVHFAHIQLLQSDLYAGYMIRRKSIADWMGIPLCEKCHMHDAESIHNIGEDAFIEKHFKNKENLLAWILSQQCKWLESMQLSDAQIDTIGGAKE